jgi:hypothetical protein
MASSFYAQHKGDYVYDVTVTKDETVLLPHRYRARLSNAERIEHGRLAAVQVDVQDAYGPPISTHGVERIPTRSDKPHPSAPGPPRTGLDSECVSRLPLQVATPSSAVIYISR